jgi:acetyl-CoA carboxylase biotin carboxyl carrier protein
MRFFARFGLEIRDLRRRGNLCLTLRFNLATFGRSRNNHGSRVGCRLLLFYLRDATPKAKTWSLKFEKERPVDLKDIKAIIDLMKKNAISEFELEKQDFKIKLKRGLANPVSSPSDDGAPGLLPAQSTGGLPAAALPLPVPSTAGDAEIQSPMIGTFYRAPSPESANYVEVGMEVNPETVVCIIEAMKVMNEIKAETRGVITQVLVENAKPVEFGQPLFKVRPL